MRLYFVLIMVIVASFGGTVLWAAAVPEPDAILFGNITVDRNTPDAGIQVLACLLDGSEVGGCEAVKASRSQMRYILRIPLELTATGVLVFANSDGIPAADPIKLIVYGADDSEFDATPYGIVLGARGTVRELNIGLVNDLDGDGLADGLEVSWGLDPNNTDSDGDGLSDMDEVRYDGDNNHYDPFDPHTGKGSDTNALSSDTDGDGLPDHWEVLWGICPIAYDADVDSDLDGFTNWEEFLRGSNPSDPNAFPMALVFYVDDDAPADPNPGDPELGDPAEDGTREHPFDSIQEAIDLAITTDTVRVEDGVYTGLGNRDIDMMGKAVSVVSASAEFGPGHCTIDCEYQGRGFVLSWGEDPNTLIEGFTIIRGFADNGAGILCQGSSPEVAHCVIADCIAQVDGGAVYCCDHAAPLLRHVTVYGNEAGGWGGGLFAGAGCEIVLSHAIFWGNSAPADGMDIWLDDVADPHTAVQMITDHCCYDSLPGCVYRGNFSALFKRGCVSEDPLFADPNTYDFHLLSASGRWDPNKADWIQDTQHSLLIDAGDPNLPVVAEMWPHGLRVNIGAYGATHEASLSLSNAGRANDLSGDGWIDMLDVELLLSAWLSSKRPEPADFDQNGNVNWVDFANMAEAWKTAD